MTLHAAAYERLARRALIAVHVGLAIGFGIAFIRTVLAPAGVVATDFTVFWSGWWLILHGHGPLLYDAAAQRAAQQTVMAGLHFQGGLMAFLNPPHVALAGTPFGWLAERAGERVAFLVWTAGSVALLVTLDRWLRHAWGATTGPARWIITSALVAFYPVVQTLNIGQASLLLGVAALGLHRSVETSRPRAGAGWLVALSIKPQMMPVVVIFLAAWRCWRVLGYGAAFMLAAATIAAVLLGPMIWVNYAVHLGELERFWGTGTPAHMVNVRGSLTRLGLIGQPSIDAASFAIWIAATLLVGILFWYRRIHESKDSRPAYALALAVGLLVSPHLFVQDVLIWTVPLMLYTAALRDAGGRWQPFAAFALAWPALFAAVRLVDLRAGGEPALPIDFQVVALVVATVTIAVGTARMSIAD